MTDSSSITSFLNLSKSNPLIAVSVCGLCLFTSVGAFCFGSNIWIFCVLCSIAFGIQIGGCLSRGFEWRTHGGSIVLLLLVWLVILWRELPIHSLESSDVVRVELHTFDGYSKVTISDPDELREIAGFLAYGHFETSNKASAQFQITVWQKSNCMKYFVHGNALGDGPGGIPQTVFVPSRPGLEKVLASLGEKYSLGSSGELSPNP